jgi:hypothetical protein
MLKLRNNMGRGVERASSASIRETTLGLSEPEQLYLVVVQDGSTLS